MMGDNRTHSADCSLPVAMYDPLPGTVPVKANVISKARLIV